jgi:PKD repeat protein
MNITFLSFVLKKTVQIIFVLFIFLTTSAQNSFLKEADNAVSNKPVSSINIPTLSKEVIADFDADQTVIYENSVVKFTNMTTGGATYFKWTIPGATPSISYQDNPSVMYHTPGFHDVTLLAIGMSGSSTLTKENYIEVLETESDLPPGWDYETTSSQMLIAVPPEANARIFEAPLDSGDFIGVFYFDMFNQLKCAGATVWTGNGSAMVIANGNNSATPVKDGFFPGETINWKVYSVDKDEDFPATATWNPELPVQTIFIPNGISGLLDLYAGVVWQLQLTEDWSAISSPVEPWYKQPEQVFGQAYEQIIFLENSTGILYPDGNINTLGEWQNEGYLLKMNEAATIDVKGYPIEQTTVQVFEGWNLIPVPVNCTVSLLSLIENHLQKVEMVKEVAGLKSCVPAQNISTLQNLKPGKSYMLFANENFTLEFAPCE